MAYMRSDAIGWRRGEHQLERGGALSRGAFHAGLSSSDTDEAEVARQSTNTALRWNDVQSA